MTINPHFETADSWNAAEAMLTFRPVPPKYTAGFELEAIRIYVRDHRQREVTIADRTCEAHYRSFVVSQSRREPAEARRLALEVSYGRNPIVARIFGHDARVYELGPEPAAEDIDGRSPAVVTWHDGDMFFLVASSEMPSNELQKIAMSLYPR
jgi:hypothetical protein